MFVKNLYESVIEPILTNEIVVNWIAPIITGMLVIAIPAIIVRFFRLKKDIKKINDVNGRFINSVRPYIIEKIKIPSALVTDIRNGIILDSDIKERFVISEMQLRNKLIMDITESKYIDEVNKKDLIDFTYDIFKDFNKKDVLVENKELSINKKRKFMIINRVFRNPIFLMILAHILIIVTLFFDKSGLKPEDNFAYFIPILLGIVSMFSFISEVGFKIIRSSVTERKRFLFDYEDLVDKIIFNKIYSSNISSKNDDKE